MKNNNVKEMIRQQKQMAEERKEMVSDSQIFTHIKFIGTPRKEVTVAKPTHKFHFGREQKENGHRKLSGEAGERRI